MTKRIVLCADDYGQAPTISKAILALIKAGRLSAVSCLVNTEDWLTSAQEIISYRQQIDIGLHLNLTEGRPLSSQYRQRYGDSFFPLAELMKRAFLNRLDQQAFYDEIEAQLQVFKEITGFLPYFLDGHQHVHQFPVIRKMIIDLYKKYFNHYPIPIRLAKPNIYLTNYLNNMKKIAIRLSGFFFQRDLNEAAIAYNPSFSGVYDFHAIRSVAEYRKLFQFFLRESAEKGLIMCHPGLSPIQNELDSIADARYREYQYLSSEAFIGDCLSEKVILGHFISYPKTS